MNEPVLAAFAYACVADAAQTLTKSEQDEYRTAVHELATNCLKLGLMAALCTLHVRPNDTLWRQLCESAPMSGQRSDLLRYCSEMATIDYIAFSQEMTRQILWLKRAVRAGFLSGSEIKT